MSKLELEDFVNYGRLFEIYGKLLSEDRQAIMTEYFQFNNTLAEIAKEKKVSRQAILDAIAKSCRKLDEFEEKLSILNDKERLRDDLQALKDSTQDNQIKEKVDKILRKI